MLTSVHIGYVLGGVPFPRRFEIARSLGFDAVEFPFPYDIPAKEYARLLRDSGLTQVSIGAPTSNYRIGEPGYSVCAALRAKFRKSISEAIEYAAEIGCSLIHVFSGALPADDTFTTGWDIYIENLAFARERAGAHGIGVAVEPINSTEFPRYFLDKPSMAKRILETAECAGIKIIFDIYHCRVMEEDAFDFLTAQRDVITHIQLADYPGRHEPGSGTIDFSAIFSTLARINYTGSLGLEYIPTSPIQAKIPLQRELGIRRRS